MILQTVQLFAAEHPPAPYIVRAPDGGWHFDCGNCSGWSLHYPSRCKCGHCKPEWEPLRAAAAEAEVCRCRHQRGSHFGIDGDGGCDVMLNFGFCRCRRFER